MTVFETMETMLRQTSDPAVKHLKSRRCEICGNALGDEWHLLSHRACKISRYQLADETIRAPFDPVATRLRAVEWERSWELES